MTHGPLAARLTRRRLLQGAGAAAAVAALGGGGFEAVTRLGGTADPVRRFRSRPDLRPSALAVSGGGAAPGELFLGPAEKAGSQPGTLIVGEAGEPVWFRPVQPGHWVTCFRTGTYRGLPVLTWWEGISNGGYGRGEGVIADSSYREIGRVRAANGREMDLHELVLTPEGTAIFFCAPRVVRMDLRAAGGRGHGPVQENVVQEVDVASGRLLLEWRSLEHVPVSESHAPLKLPYDYLHANSIDVAADGNLLVSGRHTWAVYKVDRRSGAVIWRLGGKRSDFELGRGAPFAWQHDARHLPGGSISIFDNGQGPLPTEPQSRGIVLAVDEARRSVRLAQAYAHPSKITATAMGSVQVLPDGHVLVGWGFQPYASEFAADGTLLADWRLPAGQFSYRARRLSWRAAPADTPAVRAGRDPLGGAKTLYASWNGATEVAQWQLLTGARADRLRPAWTVDRRGFETGIPLAAGGGYAAVAALDGAGRVLARSAGLRV